MPDRTAVEVQLARYQAWIVAGLIFMFVSAVSFLSVAVFVVVNTSGRVSSAKEKSDQGLACYVLPQLDRSEKALPNLQYYKDNPGELEEQLGLIADQRKLALETWGACDKIPLPR